MTRQDDRIGLSAQVMTIDDTYLSKFMRGFVTAAFYSDSACTIPATPSAGSLTLQVKYRGSEGLLDLADSPLLVTDTSSFASWQGPVERIVVTPSGVTGADYMKVSYSAGNL